MCWLMCCYSQQDIKGVSVAGCLGYDVLEVKTSMTKALMCFSCWLFRL